MFKISFYIRKKHEVSAEEFRKYWLNESAELQKRYLDDIDYFSDKAASQAFAAKEHFIIDKPVITRPMPRFFSAEY